MPAVAEKPVPRETPTRPTFEWDGWDLVREVGPDGVETVYYAPEGENLSFKRGSDVYQVHNDALGSVRLVTSSNGSELAEFTFDTWGETVAGHDNVPYGVSLKFVGSVGVRSDASSGLLYMRYRWYDPSTGVFLSRDPRRSLNRYSYALNNPAQHTDPWGLEVIAGNDLIGWCEAVAEQFVRDNPAYAGKLPQFRQIWSDALNIARDTIRMRGYQPFRGYRRPYFNDIPQPFEADPCACQLQEEIGYERYLEPEGDLDIIFMPEPYPGAVTGLMDTKTQGKVWVGTGPCEGVTAQVLAQQILHEITHAGLMRIFKRKDYWNSPEFKRRGLLPKDPNDDTKGHPDLFFGRGVDCRAVP